MEQPQLFDILGATVRALRARLDRSLQSAGLRLGQYQVLRLLWEEDGLTPRELAERLSVEMPTVTRTVQRMVRDGFVTREAHPADARSVRIRLSERGLQVQSAVRDVLDRETDAVLAGFGQSDRLTLLGLLERVGQNARE